MPYEVELKYRIVDRQVLRRKLDVLGAETRGRHRESDTYLGHPSRSFEHTDEALRIRQSQGVLRITYKGPKVDATTKTRVEIELELAAGRSSYSELIEFWRHLGFAEVRGVEKDRELWVVPWTGRDVLVCWDRVLGLGEFVELEISAEPSSLEESRQVLCSLAEQLELRDSERRSYLELLLEKDAAAADTATKAGFQAR